MLMSCVLDWPTFFAWLVFVPAYLEWVLNRLKKLHPKEVPLEANTIHRGMCRRLESSFAKLLKRGRSQGFGMVASARRMGT